MTTYDYYTDFSSDFGVKLGDFSAKVDEGFQAVADKANDWLDSFYAKFILGWPLTDHIADKVEEAMQDLADKFGRFCEDAWEKIDDLTGNPWELMQLNQAYITAAGHIRDEKTVIDRITREVSKSWSGDAYTSYAGMTDEQKAAIDAVDSGLTKAATACAEGAQQIGNIWLDVVQALIDYAGNVVDAMAEATDAGKWFSFDAGPAAKVIADALVRIADLAATLESYFVDNATVNTDMWRQLNSGLPGLDANNQWPGLAASDVDDVKDKSQWERD